jgi:hypothetical protein
MRSTGCVILPLLLLASCGPPVTETAVADDQQAKSFVDPGPAQSALYIYRTGHYAWAWPVNIQVVDSVRTPLPVVEVSVNRGEWGPFCHIREVSPEIGQAAVRSSRRIQPLP